MSPSADGGLCGQRGEPAASLDLCCVLRTALLQADQAK